MTGFSASKFEVIERRVFLEKIVSSENNEILSRNKSFRDEFQLSVGHEKCSYFEWQRLTDTSWLNALLFFPLNQDFPERLCGKFRWLLSSSNRIKAVFLICDSFHGLKNPPAGELSGEPPKSVLANY